MGSDKKKCKKNKDPADEACEQCTQNCITMHKHNKIPSPLATTFFKRMSGDDFSNVLVLPPSFAHTVQNKVGKSTRLEDSSGEKWEVKFSEVDDGLLVFGEGWNKFALQHNLKKGDLLVFHYIMDSHFVVMMYGKSGCPEIRHFGISQRQTKETMQKKKLVDDTPVKQICSIDNDYTRFLEEIRKNNLQTEVVGCDGTSKKNLVAGGGGSDDNYPNEVRKTVGKNLAKRKESNVAQSEACKTETRAGVTAEKYKESLVTPNAATYSDSLKKRLRNDDNPIAPAKIQKMEPGTSAKLQINELDIFANMQKHKPDTLDKMQIIIIE